MSEIRKLATILFADIAGYTALMQKDEQQALLFLNRFKEVLEKQTHQHRGEIVQYFGDGCLLSFESSTNAVTCAIALQQGFGIEPALPVRIGIHLGEVLYKADNVYGDGVNVASRIESLGIPGSILMSRSVRNQVKNKSEFLLASLGSFDFKNVDEPVEVFALANPGFVVPQREEMQGKLEAPVTKPRPKWMIPAIVIGVLIIAGVAWALGKGSASPLSKDIIERPVAILPFENQTMDPSLNAFGLMAQDWISSGLLEAGEATVIRENEEDFYAGGLADAGIPEGAQVVIRGRYYKQGSEQLVVTCDVVDVKTNQILHALNPLNASKDDPMPTLIDLQQKLIGYWNLGATYPGQPPRYDAYEAYTQALFMEEDFPYARKIELYEKALSLDSTFAEPLFALFAISRWGFMLELKESSLTRLRQRQDFFSPFQKLRWQSIESLSSGDIAGAAAFEWQIYEQFNLDYHATQSITFSRFANELNAVVEKEALFTPVVRDTADGYILGRLVNALYDLGRYDAALAEIEAFPARPIFFDAVCVHVRLLARLDRLDELDQMLAFYREHPIQYGGYYDYSLLLTSLCTEMYVNDGIDILPKYLALAEERFATSEAQYLFLSTNKAFIHYIKGEYEQMYAEAVKLWNDYGVNFMGEQKGVALLKLGREAELEAYIEDLQTRGDAFPGSTTYALAVIEAHRNPERAMELLKQAEDEGYEWDWYSHRHNALLKVIHDYPPFVEFTEPK